MAQTIVYLSCNFQMPNLSNCDSSVMIYTIFISNIILILINYIVTSYYLDNFKIKFKTESIMKKNVFHNFEEMQFE